MFCRTFKRELDLSAKFMSEIAEIRALLDDPFRWPEAATFEEMNLKNPNAILRAVLKVAHLEKAKKRKHRTQ
jgi:hypothetical protein